MDDKNQKERLEQELRFLKESFEAEVISKEEFEKGKDRIEKKLKELEGTNHDSEEKPKIKEETRKEIVENSDDAIKSHEETQNQESQKITEAPEKQKNEGRLFKYAVVFVVVALVIFFSYSLFKSGSVTKDKTKEIKFVAACNSDKDCKQDSKEGFCLNPGAKDAKCEFKEVQKTNVLVLNDKKNCFNCGTQRVLGILENWFGPLNALEIDYNSEEGKALAEISSIRLLPAYILDENISKLQAFEQFRQVFSKKADHYVLNEDAAGSTFYFKRESIPSRLDLFVKSGDSASVRAEKNLKEFLDNFKDVKFEKHLSDSNLSQELGIKNFPTFLVSNRVKFSGVQTADTIKENFCSLNSNEACKKALSRNLV